MMASAQGQDLEEMKRREEVEEELKNVEADPKDLIPAKDGSLQNTFTMCPSLTTDEDLDKYAKKGLFTRERARVLGDETDPKHKLAKLLYIATSSSQVFEYQPSTSLVEYLTLTRQNSPLNPRWSCQLVQIHFDLSDVPG